MIQRSAFARAFMGRLFKSLMLPVWLLLWAVPAIETANAQTTTANAPNELYPPADEPWDGTSYRALVERVKDKGLALPTLSDATTKPIFERMVNTDNIPLRMGLNPKFAVTLRFQRLNNAFDPIHNLVVLYADEAKKGKPYATELARLMVYEAKVSAAWLEVSEPYLATLAKDKRYEVHVAYLDKVKGVARQFYSGLVQGMADTKLYAKGDILQMVAAALAALPAYHPILTDQDRQDLTKKLTQQISKTTDPQLKTALTELHDTIKNRRIPT
jgi:hypothetical protein